MQNTLVINLKSSFVQLRLIHEQIIFTFFQILGEGFKSQNFCSLFGNITIDTFRIRFFWRGHRCRKRLFFVWMERETNTPNLTSLPVPPGRKNGLMVLCSAVYAVVHCSHGLHKSGLLKKNQKLSGERANWISKGLPLAPRLLRQQKGRRFGENIILWGFRFLRVTSF